MNVVFVWWGLYCIWGILTLICSWTMCAQLCDLTSNWGLRKVNSCPIRYTLRGRPPLSDIPCITDSSSIIHHDQFLLGGIVDYELMFVCLNISINCNTGKRLMVTYKDLSEGFGYKRLMAASFVGVTSRTLLMSIRNCLI